MLIWLSMIDEIDHYIFLKLLKAFFIFEDIYFFSNNKIIFRDILIQNNLKISNNLFQKLTDRNLKEKALEIYNNLKKNDFIFVSYFSKYYPIELKTQKNIPLIFFCKGDIELLKNNNKIYVYASNLSEILSNKKINEIYNYLIFNSSFVNIIQDEKFASKYNKNILIFEENIYDQDFKCDIKRIENLNKKDNLCIYIPNKKGNKSELISGLTNLLFLLNAKYEVKLVNFVENILEIGKEIYVVPGCIDNENYIFSNYLLRDGANIILGIKDIKNVEKSLCKSFTNK